MANESVDEHSVLLVEDNPDDAALVRLLLAGSDWSKDHIVQVETIAAARSTVVKGGIEAVLLDLQLPDGRGVQCVDAVRSAAADVPVVVLTGTDDHELALACIAAGAQDYVSKHDMHAAGLRRSLGYAIARARERSERLRADSLKRRLAAIVESSSDAIVSASHAGLISSWNAGAERIFGYSAAEALTRPVTEMMRTKAGTRGVDFALLASGGEELTCLRRDGATVTLSVVACELHDSEGIAVEHAAICRDITEAKRRSQELRQYNEELVKRDAQMRALAARLHSIRDEERTRISRTVHDEIGQLLSPLKF